MVTEKEHGGQEVNMEDVARLIETLEQDLKNVSSGSSDIQRLRDEVETLKSLLRLPAPRHHWVREGLHSIRDTMEDALDTAITKGLKGSQYIAEIGRILGM